MKWMQYRLEQIATKFFYGSMPRKSDLTNSGYPIFSGYRFVGYSKKYNIDRDTLIVVARGVGGTGRVEIAPKHCFLTNLSIGMDMDESIADLHYMYYHLNNQGLRYLDSGAAQSQITIENLKKHIVYIPDLPTQHRIASILSAYDDLIENNRRQIKLLEEAAQRLYREWFVELRFPGHEDVKIVDGVPEGWKKVKLQEICPVKTGKKDANFGTTDGKYPFFTCAQAPIQAPSYSFDCSAVILAGNGDFNVKIYRGQFEAYQRTYVLSPLDLEHLFLLFNSVRMNMDVLTKGASGSTIKFLTKGMIDSIELLIPPALLLDQYNKISESIQSKVELLKRKIDLSTEVRDMLLPKLMSGEMEVSS